MGLIYYTKDHEYIQIEGDTGIIGISDYAQEQLGDVVFVELPTEGRKIKKGEECAVVESVKAASEIYAPIDGEVLSVNRELEGEPAAVNENPLTSGWLIKIRISDKTQLDELMSESAYEDYLSTLT